MMNMQRILVPTDFSDNAMKAALYAADIARKTKGIIHLLHVIEPLVGKVGQPFPLHEKYLENETAGRIQELDALKKTIAGFYQDVTIEIELAKGAVVNAITDYAETGKIMGTKGATGLKEVFMGSMTGGTIGHTRLPVLAIPDEYEMEEPDAILFATNHFEKNKNLLNSITDLAKIFSATVHVAVFVQKNKTDAAGYMADARELDQYLGFLNREFPGVSFKAELLDGKDFEETIELYDEKNEVDLVAMVTYPRGFLDKLLKRSATKRMAFHSTIPVLAIPAA
jgi:nucleotide-binding universal stress UspA family protein